MNGRREEYGLPMRHYDLSPAAISNAIRLLDGDGLETAIGVGGKSMK